jgi:pyridinium-3,5-biscarboxylic acid mononucleotide synthase
MDVNVEQLLESVKDGRISVQDAALKIKGYEELGFAKIDHSRQKRKGFPEVIYGEGKTVQQLVDIFLRLHEKSDAVLATRVSQEMADRLLEKLPTVVHNSMARTLFWRGGQAEVYPGYVAVACAGTSDLPVAEEAAITAEALGCKVERVFDVGVAGIHRLFDNLEVLQKADVVIIAAGMEGALASVVGGLVAKPIIAVPTSIGYGANFGGLSALLTMLNSCATGVTVVNIDNGFGAGYSAGVIVKNKYA